jgi:hypothetical protein
MNASFDRLHELDFYISDTRGLDTTDIKARCRNIKREMEGLDLVIVDYLQMINFNKMYGDNKEQKTGQAVLDLRNMASELDCHVMTLSQFHRINKDGPPSMHYMRYSGRIEEIADEFALAANSVPKFMSCTTVTASAFCTSALALKSTAEAPPAPRPSTPTRPRPPILRIIATFLFISKPLSFRFNQPRAPDGKSSFFVINFLIYSLCGCPSVFVKPGTGLL